MPLRLRILFLFALTSAVAFAEQPPQPQVNRGVPADGTLTVPQLVARVRNSVVVITVPDRDGREEMLGTGFAVSDDGLIATNLHVVGQGRRLRRLPLSKELLSVNDPWQKEREQRFGKPRRQRRRWPRSRAAGRCFCRAESGQEPT